MDSRDPEAREIRQARYEHACLEFSEGRMSVDIFRATLFGLGWLNRDIETEVKLHRPFVSIGEVAARQLQRRRWG
jgi:hypothetical protein